MTILQTILAAAGIPSALVGLLAWALERRIAQQEKARQQRDEKREELELLILDNVSAAMELSEATARAVARIPDSHCNGDMHSALEKADLSKAKRHQFFEQQGLEHIL